jgi:alpha-1,3-glucan synthase
MVSSTAHVLHADHNFGTPRRYPQMLVRGPYNTWGYDRGVPANMEYKDGVWELEVRRSTFQDQMLM